MATPVQEFTLDLDDGTVCTGIACSPSDITFPGQRKPLVVGIHGGSCNARYFDFSPQKSVAHVAAMTGVPFIAIDRPSYGGTSSVLPLADPESFWQETAHRLHISILPTVWKTFGIKSSCAGLVLDAHSFGCPPAIITASQYTTNQERAYPLVGLILSGWGTDLLNAPIPTAETQSSTFLEYSFDTKSTMMLGGEGVFKDESAIETFRGQSQRQDSPMPNAELASVGRWYKEARDILAQVNVPVMNAMGESDWLLNASVEGVEAFRKAFTNSPRVDSSIVEKGPHALEWSVSGFGYLLRCFGWAIEVTSVR